MMESNASNECILTFTADLNARCDSKLSLGQLLEYLFTISHKTYPLQLFEI